MTLAHSDQLNMDLIDTVGFLPTLAKVGKMFVLFGKSSELFPDHLIYPANTDRIVEVISLRELVGLGLIKMMIIPFNAKVYYKLKKYNIPENEARDEALEKGTATDIKNYIR